jgi:glycosyltransferase involved in cell wall biosynthesis
LGFVYWHIVSFFLGLCEKKVDVILSPSPPLTIGFLNILIGKLKGAKVIYNVQEIYPDLLIEEGGLSSKPVISFLKWMERFVYNSSDAVTTIDPVFYDTIVNRFNDKSKLHIVPNFVDTEIYRPIDKDSLHIDRKLFPETPSLKLMYAGNIGHAQDWKPLVALAEELKNDSVEFFVIGEGVMKDYLSEEKKAKDLTKLHLFPYQPRESIPALLAYSDMQFIFMAPETEGHGFPSKVYTVMACAKPLLVFSGARTPIINFLENKDCAYLVTEKDFQLKVKLAVDIIRNASTENLNLKGHNGFKCIENSYSKQIVTKQYVDLVKNL